jgi:hypothetical protein
MKEALEYSQDAMSILLSGNNGKVTGKWRQWLITISSETNLTRPLISIRKNLLSF